MSQDEIPTVDVRVVSGTHGEIIWSRKEPAWKLADPMPDAADEIETYHWENLSGGGSLGYEDDYSEESFPR